MDLLLTQVVAMGGILGMLGAMMVLAVILSNRARVAEYRRETAEQALLAEEVRETRNELAARTLRNTIILLADQNHEVNPDDMQLIVTQLEHVLQGSEDERFFTKIDVYDGTGELMMRLPRYEITDITVEEPEAEDYDADYIDPSIPDPLADVEEVEHG